MHRISLCKNKLMHISDIMDKSYFSQFTLDLIKLRISRQKCFKFFKHFFSYLSIILYTNKTKNHVYFHSSRSTISATFDTNGDSICSKTLGSFTSNTTSLGNIAFLNSIDAPLWCIPCYEDNLLLIRAWKNSKICYKI